MNDCVNLNNKTDNFYITLSELQGSRSNSYAWTEAILGQLGP